MKEREIPVMGSFGQKTQMFKDRSHVGEELKVLAVAPPFIKVEYECFGKVTTRNINTLECTLVELPEGFYNTPKAINQYKRQGM